MSASKKPRGDSKLKTLPAERQGAIHEHALGHTLAETVAWLREDGLGTSPAALSEFLSWYGLQRQLSRNESTVETLLQGLQATRPDWTPEQIQRAGQSFFSALALEQQDPKAWALTQQLGLKKEQLMLDRKRFERESCELFLRWVEDRRAQEIAGSSGSNAEKIERLGQLMFGEEF